MAPRRTASHDPVRAAVERVRDDTNGRIEDLRADFNSAFERLTSAMEGLREDVRRGNLDRDQIQRQVMGLERQIIDTRETALRMADKQMNEAARGAVQGAAQGVAQGVTAASVGPAVEQAMRPTSKKLNQNQVIVIGGFATMWLIQFVEKAPAVFKWLEGVWKATTGMSK